MNLNYLKPDFDKIQHIEPTIWFPFLIKFEHEVVIDENLIVICFERFSCWDDITKRHDYSKFVDGIRIFDRSLMFVPHVKPLHVLLKISKDASPF